MSRARPAWVICVGLALVAACRQTSAPGDAGADGGDAALDANAPRACGASGSTCTASEYCAFEPRLCGKGKRPGTCRPRPAGCRGPYAPVCACDKKIYNSECDALAAGVDLDVTGGCREQVADWIPCGPKLCDARKTYCEIVLSDVFDLPTDYTCKALPPACVPSGSTARKCECFPAGTRCVSFCGTIDTGGVPGFHLTCRL